MDYAAKQGTEWVLLTNGIVWRAHRIRFEKPIKWDEVFSIDLLDPEAKNAALLERLYLISRESVVGSDIAKFWAHREATSRFVIAQLMLTDEVLNHIRRQMRKLSPGLAVTPEQIGELLQQEVLKREVLEGERATAAQSLLRRLMRKRARQEAATEEAEVATVPAAGPAAIPSVAAP